ncbi:MAG: class I SAM-dependent methyltransferase [Woeseiaceae bacterium]
MYSLKRSLPLILSAALAAACAEPEAPDAANGGDDPPARRDLHRLLAESDRPTEDKARDAGRKPADVIAFLGIEPGMRVLDVIAAGGYYTEVLSIAVGEDGQVVAHNTDRVLEMREGINEKTLSARLADNRLPNVIRLNRNFDGITPADGPFDAAITALNFHDIYNGAGGADAARDVLLTIRSVLRPGGVFGIIDHAGSADQDNAALHRVEIDKAIETAEAAGFVVEARSDLLGNPADDHTQGVFAEGLRGNTDRFLLRLRKPAE